MTQAISAQGTLLKVGDGAEPEVFTPIAEVLDITGPGLSLDTEDATHHGSEDGWEEVVGTILRTGEITFDVHFLPGDATQGASTGLIADMTSRTVRNYQLVFPDAAATTWTFAALVTGFQPSAPVAGKLTASVTLKPTGKPTLTGMP